MHDVHRQFLGDLAADSYGTADDRPPLVLLHGLSYDRRQWRPLLDALATLDPDRRVLAVDLPGHGESPNRESYHIGEVADVVHRAVTEAGLDAPIVVGHSLGGVIATVYAANHPSRGVVNIDQPLLVGGFGQVLREAEPVLRGPGYGQVWDRMLANMQIELLPPQARELVRTASTPRQDLLLGYWDEILSRSAEELGEQRTRDLDRIRAAGVPYHYVTRDEPNPAYRSWLSSALPDLTVSVVPDSGHFPHLAQPLAVARILAG